VIATGRFHRHHDHGEIFTMRCDRLEKIVKPIGIHRIGSGKKSFPSELIPAVAKKSLETSIPTKRLYILAPPSEIKQDMPPNQTSTVTRVLFDPINLSGLREAGNTLYSGFLTQEGVRSPAFHSLLFTLSITQLLVGGRSLRRIIGSDRH
jgi:hypothetical protein